VNATKNFIILGYFPITLTNSLRTRPSDSDRGNSVQKKKLRSLSSVIRRVIRYKNRRDPPFDRPPNVGLRGFPEKNILNRSRGTLTKCAVVKHLKMRVLRRFSRDVWVTRVEIRNFRLHGIRSPDMSGFDILPDAPLTRTRFPRRERSLSGK
jgi:hypothetical protein